jgi:hypothetical protein
LARAALQASRFGRYRAHGVWKEPKNEEIVRVDPASVVSNK